MTHLPTADDDGGWDDPATAARYRRFENEYDRYRRANAALARHAALRPGLRVLDLAAGTGGTVQALLPHLGADGRVDAVEPAAAMAHAGRARLGPDPRVRWLSSLDEAGDGYDRITCGAALWQWPDLPALLHDLAARLRPEGALVFNVPAAYLGRPDGPGGGADPWLTALHAELLRRHPPTATWPAGNEASPAPQARQVADVQGALKHAGLRFRRWQNRQRWTQDAWCAWMKLPLLTRAWWPALAAVERDRRIDEAAAALDPASWRPETWLGWTAWKSGFEVRPLPDSSPLRSNLATLRQRAQRDGALLLRGLLPAQPLATLAVALRQAAQDEGLLDMRGHWMGGFTTAPHEVLRWAALQQRMALRADVQALAHDEQLVSLVSLLIGRPAQGGRGTVCRLAPSDAWAAATPPHRDADYLPDSADVWGAWLPLEPCGVDDGVLAVSAGSHRRDDETSGWAAASLRPGDVLLLSAQTVHRACPNRRLHRVRLSIDLRFGPAAT